MSYALTKSAIENHFRTQWANRTPIVFENGESIEQGEWVRFTVIDGKAKQISMGDNPDFRHVGVAFAQIFTAKGTGSGRAIGLADVVDTIFRNLVIGRIHFRVPQIDRIPSNGTTFQINVSTEFYRGS